MRWAVLTLSMAAVCTPALAKDDLEAHLAARQAELRAVSEQVTQAATSPAFSVSRDLHASFRTSVIQEWLSKNTMGISMVGVSRTGDLKYIPGVGKAWIEVPHDTKGSLGFAPFQVASAAGQIDLNSQLKVHIESRIHFHVGGLGTNIKCQTTPDPSINVGARLSLSPGASNKLAYRVDLTSPSSIKVPVGCGVGPMTIGISFPVDDIAREISRGELELAYAEEFKIPLPTSPPTELVMALQTSNAIITVDTEMIDAGVNVTLGAPKAVAK